MELGHRSNNPSIHGSLGNLELEVADVKADAEVTGGFWMSSKYPTLW